MLKDYQRAFLDLALCAEVLKFGEFKLKSGRISPYFWNAGKFDNGASLRLVGRYYAEAIVASGIGYGMLYGPAYKGIPLAVATAIALAEQYDRYVHFAFNRKEAKDHGEGGGIIGAPLEGKVLILDDVITAGTAIGESAEIIRAHGSEPAGVVISLDRQERGKESPKSAVQEVWDRWQIPVFAIVTLDDLVEYLGENPDAYRGHLEAMGNYRAKYGVAS